MNKTIIKTWVVALAALILDACTSVSIDSLQTGHLSVNMSQDTSEDIVFKSVSAPTADQIFTLDFIRTYKDGHTNVEKTCLHTEVPEEGVSLPVGPYLVKASFGENEEAAFGEPFYTGEATVNIVAETQSTVNIICRLSNVKVTVDFDDAIKSDFEEYTVTVKNSRGGQLVFTNTGSESTIDEEGYFKVGENETLEWTLTLKRGEVSYTASDKYTDVKAKEHYNLKFSLGEASDKTEGGLFLTIKVDNSTEVKEYLAGVDLDDHLGPNISVNTEFATLLAKDDVVIPFGVEESKVVTITPSSNVAGLKSVIISHSDANLYAAGLPYMTELANADASKISKLSNIGIQTNSITYAYTDAVSLDVTKFMANLPMDKSYSYDIYGYDVYNHMAHLSFDFTVVVDADADMVSAIPWARFAIVTGKWFLDEQPEGLTFMYKKVSETEWTRFDGVVNYDIDAKTFSADIMGLDADCEYVVKAVSTADTDTRELSFKTETAAQLYNFGFENWYVSGRQYFPYPENATDDQKVWDCANAALTKFGQNSSTTYVEDHIHGGSRAVKMESKSVMGIAFAAGNIYTGEFLEVVTSGGTGAKLKWGIPFTSRPVALHGWYDYTSTEITDAQSPYADMKGQADKCSIIAFLTDWDEQFTINTVAAEFVDFDNDEHIIAYGELKSDVSTDGYTEFTIPLEYRNSRTPKYVVVVCSSSALGDYFTGGKGSVLYVDDLSFEYDITTLSAEDKAKVNYK